MENFFTYISKPIDKEDLQLWIEGNNICFEKFDLFNDFIMSLVNLIYDTYLGNDEDRTTNIKLNDEDKSNHFEWCWNKVIDDFKKEEIYFLREGEHYELLKGFITETFYNQDIPAVKYSLNKFFSEIFDLDGVHTMSDLDLLKAIYKGLDKNLDNNNLLN